MLNIPYSILKLTASDQDLIARLADWYWQEWQVPKETTLARLSAHPNDDVLFQLVLTLEGVPAASGGLYRNVGLLKVYPDYKRMGPWVAQVYTDPIFRNQGLGALLLKEIELKGASLGYKELYLYTNSAERLYERNGWVTFDRVMYRDKDTAVMRKRIALP